MNNIPPEVICLITSHLKIKDKKTCLLLCRRWYMASMSNGLYETLSTSFMKEIHNVSRIINQYPRMGSYVRQLTFTPNKENLYLIREMSELFPNVKHLIWENSSFSDEDIDIQRFENQDKSKWKYVESITDGTTGGLFTFSILMRDTLLNLEKITITNMYLRYSLISREPECWKNAPNLRKLHFTHVEISIRDLENLHMYATNISELIISESSVNGLAWDNRKVSPASNLKVFKLNFNFIDSESIEKMLIYFGHKYKRVHTFSCILMESSEIDPIEQIVTDMISSMTDLKNLCIDIMGPYTSPIAYIMNQNAIRLSNLTYFLSEEDEEQFLSPLLSSNCIQDLKELIVCTAFTYDNGGGYSYYPIFNQLTGLNNLTRLELRYNTPFPNAMKTITSALENLISLDTLICDRFVIDGYSSLSVESLPKINSKVKSLEIYFHSCFDPILDRLNETLKYLIKSCPVLQNLNLTGVVTVKSCSNFHEFNRKNCPKSTLNLYLIDHTQLKTVLIDIPGAYFTLHCSDSINNQWIKEKGENSRENFKINIMYNENTKMYLKLDYKFKDTHLVISSYDEWHDPYHYKLWLTDHDA